MRKPSEPNTLGDILTAVQYGTSAKAAAGDEGVPVLRMGNIQHGRVTAGDLKFVSLPPAEVNKYRLVAGDILINRTNSAELVGKSGVFREAGDYVFASYLIRLRVDHSKADPEFVNYAINFGAGLAFLKSQIKEAVGQANINASQIKRMPLTLPPLAEQRRLVARIEALTSRLEQARQARQATIAEADAVFQRTLELQFSEDAAEDWCEHSSESLFDLVSGQVSPRDAEFRHLPYLGPEHVESGTSRIIGERASVAELNMKSGKYLFTSEHVVYSKIRPALRKVCTPGYTGLCSADMYALKPNLAVVSKEFLKFLLLAPAFSAYAIEKSDRNAMPKINQAALREFRFRVPDLAEQDRICTLLNALLTKHAELRRLQTETEAELAAFTPALLAKAFRGEL